MADSSLDDFFAKKDKSKKKSKSSKLTPDDILSKTDEHGKKDKKSKKDKSKSQTSKTNDDKSASGVLNPAEIPSRSSPDVCLINVTVHMIHHFSETAYFKQAQEKDAEWLEVEEEQEKDYSGLRIANLQVSEKQEDTGDEEVAEENEEEDEDGETREKKDTGQQGPWKGTQTPAAPVVKPPVEEPPPPKEDSTPKGPAKYIPPAQRAAAAAAARGESPATPSGPTIPAHLRGRKKAAPNLTSEEDFPTLGGGAPPPQPQDSDTRSFEKVQYGGRQIEDPTRMREQLSVANKYAALQD